MAEPTQAALSTFWDLLHAALGLQHTACSLAQTSNPRDAALYERQALALLLEATTLLDQEEPALATVRLLATAGMARLHELQLRTHEPLRLEQSPVARPSRKAAGSARRVSARTQ